MTNGGCVVKKSTIALISASAVLGVTTVAGIFAYFNWVLNTTEEGLLAFLDPSTRLAIHLATGENYYEIHIYQLAEAEFKRAQIAAEDSKYMTDRGEAYTRLGQTAVKLNKPAEAIGYFQKADEFYDKAYKDEFVFKMEKRVHAKGLGLYEKLLRKQGKQLQADAIAEKLKDLNDELGPAEKVRGLFSDM